MPSKLEVTKEGNRSRRYAVWLLMLSDEHPIFGKKSGRLVVGREPSVRLFQLCG
jgi:hypothetical protein